MNQNAKKWIVVLGFGVFGPVAQSFAALPLHLDLDMTGAEYAGALEGQTADAMSVLPKLLPAFEDPSLLAPKDSLDPILQFGKRNLDWVNRINAAHPDQPPLSFSSAENQQGFPLDSPRTYNPSMIQKKYEDLVAVLPPAIKTVLVEGAPLTDELPVDRDTFLQMGLEADRVYQQAARWRLLSPNLFFLAQRKKNDIRGYYFLSVEADLKTKLDGFSTLSDPDKERLSAWLVNLCVMQRSEERCRADLQDASRSHGVWAFYSKYLPHARSTWDSFFTIQVARKDVRWSSGAPNLMTVPFVRPETDALVDFLKNIEDEWRYQDWRLTLNFVRSSAATTHLEFEAGSTPHVDRVGGSIITMDANSPLSEYTNQWAIRHEYGHTLGLPDCYLEFYDEASATMVSYQLDVTNLMCSRRGHLQAKHYEELKRVYLR